MTEDIAIIHGITHKGPVLWSFDVFVFFVGPINKLLNKLSSCWWFQMPWHLYNITVMIDKNKQALACIMHV